MRAFCIVTTPSGAKSSDGVDDARQPQEDTPGYEQSHVQRVVRIPGQEHVAESE
jgi:hypothetical protein